MQSTRKLWMGLIVLLVASFSVLLWLGTQIASNTGPWMKGFFEIFGTAVVALIATHLGLLRASTAAVAVLIVTLVYIAGGVIGTLHHLYFVGSLTAVVTLGASFSALERSYLRPIWL